VELFFIFLRLPRGLALAVAFKTVELFYKKFGRFKIVCLQPCDG
jgi:hypothetical protein